MPLRAPRPFTACRSVELLRQPRSLHQSLPQPALTYEAKCFEVTQQQTLVPQPGYVAFTNERGETKTFWLTDYRGSLTIGLVGYELIPRSVKANRVSGDKIEVIEGNRWLA
jgi:hypothetical protein